MTNADDPRDPRDIPIGHHVSYYRGQAARARRLASAVGNRETEALLSRIAEEYDDTAADVESGAIEIRHPELIPRKQR
jgi:hypothetical protein